MSAIRFALSCALVALAVDASVLGLLGHAYAKETLSWAAQARGQDLVTLGLAAPVLAAALPAAKRGSKSAYLLYLGSLIYFAYVSLIYAFSIRFSALFPVYIAVLGLSVHLLIAGIAAVDPVRFSQAFDEWAPVRPAGDFLLFVSGLFYMLWGGQILLALVSGTVPPALAETNLPTNPVHVIDLALLLPSMAITGLSLLRGRAIGYLMAAPLLLFSALMGTSIFATGEMTSARGVPFPSSVLVGALALTAVALGVLTRFLGSLRSDAPPLAAFRRA
jgi:hypothetical protein